MFHHLNKFTNKYIPYGIAATINNAMPSIMRAKLRGQNTMQMRTKVRIAINFLQQDILSNLLLGTIFMNNMAGSPSTSARKPRTKIRTAAGGPKTNSPEKAMNRSRLGYLNGSLWENCIP